MNTQTTKLENGAWVDNAETCPVHGTPERKQYNFGRYRMAPCPTAWVVTYKGCGCAVQVNGASLRKLYFTSYQAAESEARFTVSRIER